MDATNKTVTVKRVNVRYLTVTAMLSAVAYILMFLDFSVPFMPSFIKMDLSELPALIGSFAMGPLCGVIICLVKNVLHLFITSTGGVGELSNFILGVAFVLPAGLLYKHKKTRTTALIGSVPTPTYGENIGVMAVTKVYSVQVIAGAAVISIICSFIGKLSTLIQTIPGPVIGGISFLLYGMIGTSGLRILVDSKVDYGKNRNQALTAVIFVTGLSGIKVNFGNVQLTGMVLACVVGMILSLIFYIFDKMKFTNDQ